MAINWNWNEKVGEMKINQGGEEDSIITLYQGNAMLIMLWEYEENEKQMYSLYNFLSDKTHAERCFGLHQKDGFSDNIFNTERNRIKEIKIYKDKYKYTKDLINIIIKADFEKIKIEIIDSSKIESPF